MLDVHPPHHPTHTWKDFFLHIATIVVGLLIAVGLEQTVEAIHRKHQVEETRAALDIERRVNRGRFAGMTEQFERSVPILQRNLAVFLALRQHPGGHGPLPELDWNVLRFPSRDGEWQMAKQANVVQWMPLAEARREDELYRRLHDLDTDIYEETKAINEATVFAVSDPDPTHLSAQQLDRQIELTAQVLQTFRVVALDQDNLHTVFPDFSPAPTREEAEAIRHQILSPGWIAYRTEAGKRINYLLDPKLKESSSSK